METISSLHAVVTAYTEPAIVHPTMFPRKDIATFVRFLLSLLELPLSGQSTADRLVAAPDKVDDGLLSDVYDGSDLDAQTLLEKLGDIMIHTDDSEGTERDVEGA